MKTFHSKECLHYIATHSFYLKIGDDGADAVIVTVTLAERSLSFWINAIIGNQCNYWEDKSIAVLMMNVFSITRLNSPIRK